MTIKERPPPERTALVVSDLHLEWETFDLVRQLEIRNLPAPEFLILPGDIGVAADGVEWAARQRDRLKCEVIYVKGNHELYGHEIEETVDIIRIAARREGIHFLDCGEIILGNVRFLGCTLWTDFLLQGEVERVWSVKAARDYMNDFRVIRNGGAQVFTPEDSIAIHKRELAWLTERLSAQPAGRPDLKTFVVTHHLPLPNSVAPCYWGDSLSPAFASDLTALVTAFQPEFWAHGHTHVSFDYMAGDTRVVCNPRGYRDENRKFSLEKRIVL